MEEKNLFSFFGNSFLEIQFTYHAVHVFKLCDCIKRYSTLLIIREMQIKTTMRYQLTLVRSSSVQSLSRVWLFATPWTAARQASLSITISQSLLKLMSIKSVVPSNHLILCHPLLLPLVFPSQHEGLPWLLISKVLEVASDSWRRLGGPRSACGL